MAGESLEDYLTRVGASEDDVAAFLQDVEIGAPLPSTRGPVSRAHQPMWVCGPANGGPFYNRGRRFMG